MTGLRPLRRPRSGARPRCDYRFAHFLNPTIKAVAVPNIATTGQGIVIHLRSNTSYRTVGIVPNTKSHKMLLLVQRRNSDSLYDFPVCILYRFSLNWSTYPFGYQVT